MSRKPDVQVAPPPLPPEQAEEIRKALRQVLESHHFRGSRRCQLLLRHITEQTILGDSKGLKERTLGIAVFGRTPDYDTSQDPIVRATAAEVRKKLAQYYQDPGHESETRIGLVSGSYVAEFYFDQSPPLAISNPLPPVSPVVPEAAVVPEPADAAAAADLPVESVWARLRRRRSLRIGALGLVALLLVAVALLTTIWKPSSLDRFWSPVLKSPGPILICVGQPIAYNLRSAAAQDAIQAEPPLDQENDSGGETIAKKDLVILWDRYVALGDTMCLVRLTSFLGRFGKPYHIRGARSTTFADLRENTAVIIAAFDNQWTERTAGPLRFTFVKDHAHNTDLVHDSLHPQKTDWQLVGAWPHWQISHDYVVISRVLRGATDRPVMMAAGITEYGTRAAGEFLSTPEYFEEVVSRLPPDWEKKNIQIVLYVPVVERVPGHPQILATQAW